MTVPSKADADEAYPAEPPAEEDDGTDLVVTLPSGNVVPFSEVVRRSLAMSDSAATATARLSTVERAELLRGASQLLSEPSMGSWLKLLRDLSSTQRGDIEDLSEASAVASSESSQDTVVRAAALPSSILTRYVEASSVSSARAQARLSALQSGKQLHQLATELLAAGL